MPLIEIINITLLSLSVGLLGLMGISYFIYRYRDFNLKRIQKTTPERKILPPKEYKTLEIPPIVRDNRTNRTSKFQIVKTYSQKYNSDKSDSVEKFIVVNKNIPSPKNHSPKVIYIVSSSSISHT